MEEAEMETEIGIFIPDDDDEALDEEVMGEEAVVEETTLESSR